MESIAWCRAADIGHNVQRLRRRIDHGGAVDSHEVSINVASEGCRNRRSKIGWSVKNDTARRIDHVDVVGFGRHIYDVVVRAGVGTAGERHAWNDERLRIDDLI